jgi:PhnB protein
MTSPSFPLPESPREPYPTLCAALIVPDAPAAIRFYQQVFGAVELFRLHHPRQGNVRHAELLLGESLLLLGEPPLSQDNGSGSAPSGPAPAPCTAGVRLSLMVSDVEATVKRAVDGGATLIHAPADHFHGYRCALLRDPFGQEWMISQLRESLSPAEMQRRWEAGR